MKRKYIGRFDIETPYGSRESFTVRPKTGTHFMTSKAAENAARKAGHVKLQSRRFPIGSTKTAYSEPVDVLSDREIRNSSKGNLWGFKI